MGLRTAAGAVAAALAFAAAIAGCSPRAYVARRVADAVAAGGDAFAAEDDLDLAREAAPFALKAMESLLAANPRHAALRLSLCRGFAQYAAFVRQEAAETGDRDAAEAGQERAWRLFLRARDYGMQGLEIARPGFAARFAADPRGGAGLAGAEEVPLLYWTAAAWGLAVSARPAEPAMLADLPRFEALMRRALALREDFGDGAIHEFFVAFEGGRPEALGGSPGKARGHFARAMELAAGKRISPFVTLAESVSVKAQDRAEFTGLLERALAFDPGAGPREYRLANVAARRKARWLMGRVDELFLD